MSELERSLAELARRIDWPATPSFAAPSGARRRSRGPLVLVLASIAALGIAFAVPGARSAILRALDLGGVSIERVGVLPPASEASLAAHLGAPVTVDAAKAALRGPIRLPAVRGRLQLYLLGGVVSALLAVPEPALLSEFRTGDAPYVLNKLVGGSTEVVSVTVGSAPGFWIAGSEHVYIAPEAPPRLAGNVLLWQWHGITYRLEARGLSERLALRLAGEIDGT